jgi:hypothetical protein
MEKQRPRAVSLAWKRSPLTETELFLSDITRSYNVGKIWTLVVLSLKSIQRKEFSKNSFIPLVFFFLNMHKNNVIKYKRAFW